MNSVRETRGEYNRPQQRVMARVEFLLAIARIAPSVLRSLATDVLPVFKECRQRHLYPLSEWWQRQGMTYGIQDPDVMEAEMVAPIMRWAAGHHLAGPNGESDAAPVIEHFEPPDPESHSSPVMSLLGWVYQVVMDTLEKWADEGAQPIRWNLSRAYERAAVWSGSLRVEVSWDVVNEQEHEFRKRTKSIFEQSLDEYVMSIKQLAQPQRSKQRYSPEWQAFLETLSENARGAFEDMARPSPSLIKLPERFSPHHYDWLVWYQIMGQSRNKIALELHQDRTAVADGVNMAARMVFGDTYRSWLRSPRSGRPRKGQ